MATRAFLRPVPCVGSKKERVDGNSDPRHISTGYAERANL
jgi:hypothetical protein